jgi:hypothetical protein
MFEGDMTKVLLKEYSTTIISTATGVITDSAEAQVGRTKRPILHITCLGTGLSGNVTLAYQGKVTDLPFAEQFTVQIPLMLYSTGVYVGSKAIDFDYPIIKLVGITNGAGASITNTKVYVTGINRDV